MDVVYRLVPPSTASLVESLRGVGYSMPTAIADIIDNSISAHARNVWLAFIWGGNPTVRIMDDGEGMDQASLIEAMRLGSRDPRETRSPNDLGRFGLGLKTASFSQCRRLTVASRRQGRTECFRWDLDYIENDAKDWHLLAGAAPGSEKHIEPLGRLDSGTVVLWEELDRLASGETDSELSERVFLETIEHVEAHLAMVFHRFLDGQPAALRIYMNGEGEEHRIAPWDPFLTRHPATIVRPIERMMSIAGAVEVQGFVLPHKDHLDQRQYDHAAGPDGWTAQQGFYVYRNRRMLVAGSWLGLGSIRQWTKEEAYKLARLRLDMPNTADEEWKIDIKKSVARPPAYLRSRLRSLADDARQLARQVLAHRGAYGMHAPEPDLEPVWITVRRKDAVTYRIDRDHPAVQQVATMAGMDGAAIEAMLRVIEETVPVQRIWLDTTDRGEVSPGGFEDAAQNEVASVLAVLYRDLRKRTGMTVEQARARLLRTEPFNRYPELVAALSDGAPAKGGTDADTV